MLTNSGTIGIGTTSTLANATVQATGVTNFVDVTLGAINVYGNTSAINGGPYQGTVNISSAAGFGVTGRSPGGR